MHRSRRTTAALLAGGLLAGALSASAPASAGTVVVPDPTAQNVTAYASTAAWSRRAADGSHRLVVMSGGVVADAAVDPSSVPFDADLGPTKSNGRLVVYSRCGGATKTHGCDVYGYEVGTRVERRIAAVSSSRSSEIGPSYFKGALAFGRIGPRGGLYVYRPGKGVKRVWSGTASQTDLSASRVIASNALTVRISTPSGDNGRTERRGMRRGLVEAIVSSPVLARYRAFWLVTSRDFRSEADPASSIVETLSMRSRSRDVRRVDRPFAGAVHGFALGARSVPALTSGAAGISRIDPPLQIPF